MTTRILINNLQGEITVIQEQINDLIAPSIGPTGAQGAQGDVGATGSSGVSTNTGATGYTGATGPHGMASNTGATGSKGDTGFTGANGSIGVTGNTGPTGANGLNGTNGINGDTGDTGNTGPTGEMGHTGPMGGGGGIVESISVGNFLQNNDINPAIPILDLNVGLPAVSGMSLNANTDGTLFWEERLQSINANQQPSQVHTYLTINKADPENNLIDLNVSMPTGTDKKFLTSSTNGLLSFDTAITTLTSSNDTILITENSGSLNSYNLEGTFIENATSPLNMDNFYISNVSAMSGFELIDNVRASSSYGGLLKKSSFNQVFTNNVIPHITHNELKDFPIGYGATSNATAEVIWVPSLPAPNNFMIWELDINPNSPTFEYGLIEIPLTTAGTTITDYNFLIGSSAYSYDDPNFVFPNGNQLTILSISFVSGGGNHFLRLQTNYQTNIPFTTYESLDARFEISDPTYDIPPATTILSNGRSITSASGQFIIENVVISTNIGLLAYNNSSTVEANFNYGFYFYIDTNIPYHLVVGERPTSIYPRISLFDDVINIETTATSNIILSTTNLTTSNITLTNLITSNITSTNLITSNVITSNDITTSNITTTHLIINGDTQIEAFIKDRLNFEYCNDPMDWTSSISISQNNTWMTVSEILTNSLNITTNYIDLMFAYLKVQITFQIFVNNNTSFDLEFDLFDDSIIPVQRGQLLQMTTANQNGHWIPYTYTGFISGGYITPTIYFKIRNTSNVMSPPITHTITNPIMTMTLITQSN
jgi:hypothetical protein